MRGNIWVVDGGAHHIVKYDPLGTRIGELSEQWDDGNGNERFRSPASIAFDQADHLFVSDTDNHRIPIFEGDGDTLQHLGLQVQPGWITHTSTVPCTLRLTARAFM